MAQVVAQGALHTQSFTGVITSIDDAASVFPDTTLNDSITGYRSIETDGLPNPQQGGILHDGAMGVTIGSLVCETPQTMLQILLYDPSAP